MRKVQSRTLRRNALIWMLISIVLIIGLNLTWSWCKRACFVPIQVVSLTSKLQYAEPQLIKAAVAEEVQRGYFGVGLVLMRDKLLQVPWVIGAEVTRQWPHTILLQIAERQPLALFGEKGAKGIIDTQGKLFMPSTASM